MKKHLKKLTTTKLFYGKWPFKLTCRLSGAHMIKRQSIDYVIVQCLDDKNNWTHRYDRKNLLEFAYALQPHANKDMQIRTGGSSISFFVKDRILLYTLEYALRDWTTEISEPANEQELKFLMDHTSRKIVCNALPYEKYRYRVKLKYDTNLTVRANFSSWIKNYNGKIKPTGQTISWFNGGGYGWAPSIYVEDASTLSMVGLFLGNSVQSIEEFIPRSKINIDTDQEIICQP